MALTARAALRRGRLRVSSLVAVAALAAGALSACGGGGDGGSGGSADIVVAHGYTDKEATALQAAADDWNGQHPDQKVTLQFNGGNDSALQKTLAGFTAGNFPDVAYEYGSSAAQLARQPKLVDLTDRVKDASVDWNDFFLSGREAATVDGKVVGVPALIDNLSLVYNKKLFEEAGVAPPTNDWTWEDFRNAAKQLTDSSTRTYGWAYVNDGSEDTVWRYLAMLWQAGGDLLNADNTAPAFDSAAGKAALQQLYDMAVTDKSVYLDNGNGNYLNLFNSGKIAMLWTGPWDLSSINADVPYGVTYLPGYQGNHETISGPDLYMLFDHSSARSDSAFDFVSWLTSADEHIKFAIATGDLPVRQSETKLPAYQTFLKKYPAEKVFVANLDNVKHVRPNIPQYAEVSQAIGTMVQSVLLGQASPDDALKEGSDQVTSALAGS
ncbi:MAG TPA: ABC transporter substrate-binding protein [Nocardioides sp.]|nr:ABC transporter substrate-binding protein [Nocardioides sp.]